MQVLKAEERLSTLLGLLVRGVLLLMNVPNPPLLYLRKKINIEEDDGEKRNRHVFLQLVSIFMKLERKICV